MTGERRYPQGVTCWIDTEQPDPGEASRFYGGLFGWTFQDAVPAGVPGSYLIAALDGQDVAAIGPAAGSGSPVWNTYIAVDDADQGAAAVFRAGGSIESAPADAGPGGRAASCTDPAGVPFRLWQARRRLGAQVANVPGAWNFSNLHADDPEASLAFYSSVFGWLATDLGQDSGMMIRVPGYGDHLAATSDPGIRERQAFAPEGFADVIGGVQSTAAGETPHWHVTFTVADRDLTAAAAERLGGTVVSVSDTTWTKEVLLRDPQGAEFTASQFTPPG